MIPGDWKKRFTFKGNYLSADKKNLKRIIVIGAQGLSK